MLHNMPLGPRLPGLRAPYRTTALGFSAFHATASDFRTTPIPIVNNLHLPSRSAIPFPCATGPRRGDACTCMEVRRAPRTGATRCAAEFLTRR